MLNLSQILLERTWEKRETPGTALAFFVGKIRSFSMWFEMLLYIWVCMCVCVWSGEIFCFYRSSTLPAVRSSESLAISKLRGQYKFLCKQFRTCIYLASRPTMASWCLLKTAAATELSTSMYALKSLASTLQGIAEQRPLGWNIKVKLYH